ncbi:MAG: radical SAM protein [Lachnospiraceae bacterium]|nr:radical SAM protein [Lachnospiraceae bacterium]
MENKLPLINIARLRMETDGDGVTTLVAAAGCPLSCKYCINRPILERKDNIRQVSPEELLGMVSIDDLYFQATGGGIVFGGGESLLHAAFIRDFAAIMPKEWKLIVETSLNVPEENLRLVMPYADYYIVDIKETDSEIYRAYTGADGEQAYRNLRLLADSGLADKVKVRVPLIPGFNTPDDCRRSAERLQEIAQFDKIDIFSYIIREGTDL